jgi:hypothetical protein
MRSVRFGRAAVLCVSCLVGGSCVGGGEGRAIGTWRVPLCGGERAIDWPLTFFAAERTGAALDFRAQNGGAVPEFTDHLYFRVDDTSAVRARLARSTEVDPTTGQRQVTLEVGPQGARDVLVHAFLALRWSCGRMRATRLGYNVSLPSIRGTIVFRAIDDGPNGGSRITDVPRFDVTFRDDRPIGEPAPAGFSPADSIGSATVRGSLRFAYDTAVPAQLFPGGGE